MSDSQPDRAEIIRAIAEILATAYLRLRFPETGHKPVDCAETKSDSCVNRLTL
jgi:hypothetical protein